MIRFSLFFWVAGFWVLGENGVCFLKNDKNMSEIGKIGVNEVRGLSKLARLELNEVEVEKFGKQLGGLFEYIDVLNEVNVDGVEPTAQVTGLKSVVRPDVVEEFSNKDGLISSSPQKVVAGQIMVKAVIE